MDWLARMERSIWIGFEPRESDAFAVAKETCSEFAPDVPVRGLCLSELRSAGLYWRPTERRNGRLFDVISEHPMATEFAISRFLVPTLAKQGKALFMDCDMLVRRSLAPILEGLDPSKAVHVVKHDHRPTSETKMDGQVQSAYARKNWSSVMVFNCDHPSNRKLTVDLVNSVPGRDLHAFCWLEDDEIGELGPEWNWLVGHSSPDVDPAIVHFTDGVPSMAGYEDAAFADEWRSRLNAFGGAGDLWAA